VYDPVLTPLEVEFARSRGCTVPEHNGEGRICAEEATLFFMPHCAKQLYCNVLAANYRPEALARLAILGNSFESYAQVLHSSRRDAEAEWSHMIRLAPYVTEVSCDQGLAVGAFSNAFNNLSLHTFSSASLPSEHDEFWKAPFTQPPEDAELIGRLILPEALEAQSGGK